MKINRRIIAVLLLLLAGTALSQDFQRRWRRGRRVTADDRKGVPNWNVDKEFQKDLFTFVRIQYTQNGRWGWETDYPDADLNFSFRLQEMTSLKVDPNGDVIRLTDPKLFDYPFIYMAEPGSLYLHDEEVVALRQYLDRGGFLMVDDFWGEYEWRAFYRQIKKVLPDREPIDLTLDHEIFNIVYKIKEKPIVPSIHAYMQGWRTERSDAREAHYRAIVDDENRIMVMICHNTDLGDGWEREGVDAGYFKEYSEKFAYPLGINIVTYAMTH